MRRRTKVIQCDAVDCQYNKLHNCIRTGIVVDSEFNCKNFKSMHED